MKCAVCATDMTWAFRTTVLGRYQVNYHRCNRCGLVQTDEPYWLEEAYSRAIVDSDTGLVQRNLDISRKLASLLYFGVGPHGNFIDVAGGYGLLVRLMRDLGFNFFWEDKYCRNLMAAGFESSGVASPVAAITAFEVLEHVHDPLAFIDEALKRHEARTFIFSTDLYEGETAPPPGWWYYAHHAGQHVSFYQRKTLATMAAALGLHFSTCHGLHVFSDKPIPRHGLICLLMTHLGVPVAAYIKWRLGSKMLADHAALIGRHVTAPGLQETDEMPQPQSVDDRKER